MEINGKVYRNLEGQVEYLTGKWDDLQGQINDVRAHLTHYVIVDALPTEDIDPSAVYLVGPLGTAPDQYYEEWVYVQKADESWMWEKLGDTASVDLSGYLQKVTTTTIGPQAYVKNSDGTQTMIDIYQNQTSGNSIARRTSGGQLVCASPEGNNDATTKYYVDTNFVAKQTGSTTYSKLYAKHADGGQVMFDVTASAVADAVVKRTAGAQVDVPYTPTAATNATSKDYVDSTFVAKQTGTTTNYQAYCKAFDGSQAMLDCIASPTAYAKIPLYVGTGNLIIGDPTASNHAATKAYVDAAVGQLIYHHDMVIQYTLTGDTDYVKIAAHIDDNASTAYTDVNWHNMPLIMPDYAMYHHGSNDYLASVTKLPRGLHQDEFSEPRDGFLLTYWDGSALQNVRVNSNIFNTPTVTDVVTTW